MFLGLGLVLWVKVLSDTPVERPALPAFGCPSLWSRLLSSPQRFPHTKAKTPQNHFSFFRGAHCALQSYPFTEQCALVCSLENLGTY